MAIRVKFVEFGEHAKVKVVGQNEKADMEIISVAGGEDIRVKRVESGEVFRVKFAGNNKLNNTLVAYSMGDDNTFDMSRIRVFRLLEDKYQ